MPAAIPDRYKLEMRLGRDGDIEEWLATDTSLDRPVLVRSVGPETSPGRRKQFVGAVSGAAKVSHPHLARVFAVDEVEGGAYAVCEWTGGSTAADRVEADHTIELPDFVPNASGLAGALAALHAAGGIHGALDLSAISYSVAHAAKLGAFGRIPRSDQRGDVRGLAAALETALTGSSPGGPPPSERIDGLPRAIDRILRSGQSGELSADQLEDAFLAAPTPRQPAPEPRATSRRLIAAAITLVLIAIGIVALGLVFTEGGEPIIPAPATSLPSTGTTMSPLSTTLPPGEVVVENAASYDPFGEGGENDINLRNLWDGDITTTWQTERYTAPFPSVKEGVGVTLTVSGAPSRLELVGLTRETMFEIYWSDTFFAQLDAWARLAGGVSSPGATFVDLPHREDGFWLVWLTRLPERSDGLFYASMSEVRFLP